MSAALVDDPHICARAVIRTTEVKAGAIAVANEDATEAALDGVAEAISS